MALSGRSEDEPGRWEEYERPVRLPLEETWAELEGDYDLPRDGAGSPLVHHQMPQPLDDDVCFSIHKSGYEYLNMAGFTLPRSYFGRSRFEWANFTNTDFHESRFCWNDFVDCSFRHGDLTGADLRASLFLRCRFDHADLTGSDLRGSELRECTFFGADLSGCRVSREVADQLPFSAEQIASIQWEDDDGEEAPGG